MHCEYCGFEAPNLYICPQCSRLRSDLPAHSYFEALDLKEKFPCADSELEAAYENLMQSLHPDFFATENPSTKALSEKYAAEAQMAKEVLRDPYLLAHYILKRKGLSPSAADLKPDPQFLMEILEKQEYLEQQKPEAIEPTFVQEVRAEYNIVFAHLKENMQKLLESPAGENLDLSKLYQTLSKFRYHHNLYHALEHM